MADQVIDFEKILRKNNPQISGQMVEKFERYATLLVEWNKKMNLTAITELSEIAIKHFSDSLLTLNVCDISQGATMLDVGTGAGFPGLPIKIVRPDLNLTLLDSLNKRIKFLDALRNNLKVDVKLIHERAEAAAQKIFLRESFDIVVSRAVAPLNILLEYCVPFAKVGGFFIALKGKNLRQELDIAQNAIKTLNTEIFTQKSFSLVAQNDRNIVVFKKLAKNLNIYPRNSAKIKKKPL